MLQLVQRLKRELTEADATIGQYNKNLEAAQLNIAMLTAKCDSLVC